ncbi:L-fuconolactonase [Pantoea sp. AN62]|uniref:amidohydrolase family protein n=1 Tax=Pantoea TaxID=53335 RepID=UPI000A24F925|nr:MULTISPECIES: amidohydrolase family protein [Pantoea]MDU4127789.1 amidohydrolase family protein [Pantoea sp.]MDU4749029.1 amidohydrolase family protein [Pantoea sp.]ORM51745.1 amidohydrolase [Pantoea brenneri]HAI06817.1 amidohydrolase [Pantoea sp.]
MMRVDSHQHFWRYTAQDYRWINDDMGLLKQDFLPQTLRPILQRHDVQKTVLVQARCSLEETRWLLDIAGQTDFVAAVTGWIDLRDADLPQQLERLAHPLLRGFRHPVQDEPYPAHWLADPAINAGIRQLQQREYLYELLVTHHHLAEAVEFAQRHDQHFLVLDHFGKPDLTLGASHWKQQVAPLKALKHVSCKLSGLLTEPRPAGLSADDLLPFFDAALEIFGSERLMFGSDWPVSLLAGADENPWQLWQPAIAKLSAAEQAAIYGGNACSLYRLQETHDESVSAK